MSRAPRPAGVTPRSSSASQTVARAVGRDQQLHAVLARVAGAAHAHLGHARHRGEGPAHPLRLVALEQLAQRGAGVGALQREHRELGVGVVDLHVAVEAGRLLREPGQVALMVRRVGDREESAAALGEAVGEQVVDHTPVLPAQHRVLRAVLGDLGHVVGEDPLKEALGVRARRADLAHVGDVEHAGAGAHGDVLLAHPLVLHGHLPAREGHQPRPRRLVAVEQGRAAQRVGGGRHAREVIGGRLSGPAAPFARGPRGRRPSRARGRSAPRAPACEPEERGAALCARLWTA